MKLLAFSECYIRGHLTHYQGIALPETKETGIKADNSIRNIDYMDISVNTAAGLWRECALKKSYFLQSLQAFAAREQFNHLRSLFF